MIHKFQILKSSWGIVIILDVNDINEPEIRGSDIEVAQRIYLRINDAQKLNIEISSYWLSRCLKDMSEEIKSLNVGQIICYSVDSIDFLYTDFQEEALYYAMQEWIIKRYKMQLAPIDIAFSKSENRYLFPISRT